MNSKTFIPTIDTERLTLRPLYSADAETLHRIYQVDGVLRYFPNPKPPALDKLQHFIESQENHWGRYGYGNWGILPRGEKEIVGWAGLQFIEDTAETEVGFLLDKPFWGRGYATEIAEVSLRFGFDKKNLEKIIGLVHPENLASQRVLEKCGLRKIDQKVYFGIELFRYWILRADFTRLDAN
jgi:ribosomal-protein-alanine N-acetyltransferase